MSLYIIHTIETYFIDFYLTCVLVCVIVMCIDVVKPRARTNRDRRLLTRIFKTLLLYCLMI